MLHFDPHDDMPSNNNPPLKEIEDMAINTLIVTSPSDPCDDMPSNNDSPSKEIIEMAIDIIVPLTGLKILDPLTDLGGCVHKNKKPFHLDWTDLIILSTGFRI